MEIFADLPPAISEAVVTHRRGIQKNFPTRGRRSGAAVPRVPRGPILKLRPLERASRANDLLRCHFVGLGGSCFVRFNATSGYRHLARGEFKHNYTVPMDELRLKYAQMAPSK